MVVVYLPLHLPISHRLPIYAFMACFHALQTRKQGPQPVTERLQVQRQLGALQALMRMGRQQWAARLAYLAVTGAFIMMPAVFIASKGVHCTALCALRIHDVCCSGRSRLTVVGRVYTPCLSGYAGSRIAPVAASASMAVAPLQLTVECHDAAMQLDCLHFDWQPPSFIGTNVRAHVCLCAAPHVPAAVEEHTSLPLTPSLCFIMHVDPRSPLCTA
jgi:hypothetical protein